MTVPAEKIVERSVDGLQKLYAVVVALSISQAVMNYLKDRDTISALLTPAAIADAPQLLALLVTVVPFYHGMNRHLERSYLEKDAGPRHGALLLDFVAFFLEAFLLLGIAWSIRKGLQAYLFLGALLIIDVLWGAVSHFIHYAGGKSTVLRWSTVNVVFVFLGFFLWRATIFSSDDRAWAMLALCVLRSIADYWLGWSFYFPTFPAAASTSGDASSRTRDES